MLRRDCRIDNLIGYSHITLKLISTCETAESEERGGEVRYPC